MCYAHLDHGRFEQRALPTATNTPICTSLTLIHSKKAATQSYDVAPSSFERLHLYLNE